MQKTDQGAQWPVGPPHWTQPQRMRMQQEQEDAIGQGKGENRGLLAGRKTRPASPLEWETKRGAPRPPEWRENPGGIAREWECELSCRWAPTPLEWRSCFMGTNPWRNY